MSRFFTASILLAGCLLLGACATQTGGYGSVQTPAMAAATAEPLPSTADDKVMYLQLIQQMQQRGLYYASLAHIDAYAKRYGTPPSLQILRADALRKTQKPAAAAAIYKALLKGPQAAAAWHGLGLIAAAQGHYQKAASNLTHAVQLAPINASYLGDLGFARLHTGDLEGARVPLAKAAELAPTSDKAVANLALLVMLEGHDAKANAMMNKAKLPQDTRKAVVRLAARLRQSYASTGAPAAATAPQTNATASRMTTQTDTDGVPRIYGISANILDRFNQNHATRGENHHDQP